MSVSVDTFTVILPEALTGPRVRLRQWTDADREPFAALNADPAVMEHFPSTLTREQSDRVHQRLHDFIDQHGWGFWAADTLADGRPQFIGFVGLLIPPADLHFKPCVEIGWRLARPFWGQGLATEGTRALIEAAFAALGARTVTAQTMAVNLRSRRVMERCGMRYLRTFHREWADPLPGTAEGEVEYELTFEDWRREHP